MGIIWKMIDHSSKFKDDHFFLNWFSVWISELNDWWPFESRKLTEGLGCHGTEFDRWRLLRATHRQAINGVIAAMEQQIQLHAEALEGRRYDQPLDISSCHADPSDRFKSWRVNRLTARQVVRKPRPQPQQLPQPPCRPQPRQSPPTRPATVAVPACGRSLFSNRYWCCCCPCGRRFRWSPDRLR